MARPFCIWVSGDLSVPLSVAGPFPLASPGTKQLFKLFEIENTCPPAEVDCTQLLYESPIKKNTASDRRACNACSAGCIKVVSPNVVSLSCPPMSSPCRVSTLRILITTPLQLHVATTQPYPTPIPNPTLILPLGRFRRV